MELDQTSEARRKAQRNGEEDPVVVAQRFLNIYRQIHIFNNEKKQAFNKMLLELSPQIRGMFGQLPGGALLQDYVDELAEQEGVEKSIQSHNMDIADEEVKQAKILATALAEAQVQATTKMQEMGVANVQPITQPQISTSAGTTKLAFDKKFAEDFAKAMGDVMRKNTEMQNNEISKILNSLGQFQAEAIKNIQQENSIQRNEVNKIAQLLIENQKTYQEPQKTVLEDETKQLLEILVSNQKQINDKIAKIDTSPDIVREQIAMLWHRSEQNMGKLVAFLNEKQRKDSFEIAKMITESQQKLWNMVVQNNTLNQNSGNASANNNIQINSSDYSAVLANIADKLGALNSQPQKIEINFPEQAFSELIKTQSQIYKQIASEQTQELSKAIVLALKNSHTSFTNFNNDMPSDQPIEIPKTQEFDDSSTQIPEIRETTDNVNLEQENLQDTEEPPLKKKKKKKKKKKSIITNPLFAPFMPNNDDIDEFYEDDVNIETLSTNGEHSEAELSSKEDIASSIYPENELGTDFNSENNTEMSATDDFSTSSEVDTIATQSLEQEISDIFKWDFEENENNPSEYQPAINSIASDWGFGEYEQENSNVEITDDFVEGLDWEWEYVETNQENDDLQGLNAIGENSLIQSGDLFFQQQVYNPYPKQDSYPINITDIPLIKDSATSDANDYDPYKNSVIKD